MERRESERDHVTLNEPYVASSSFSSSSISFCGPLFLCSSSLKNMVGFACQSRAMYVPRILSHGVERDGPREISMACTHMLRLS